MTVVVRFLLVWVYSAIEQDFEEGVGGCGVSGLENKRKEPNKSKM